VHDGDLDLRNNWHNQDYLRYYPESIKPHVSPINLNDPASGWYSFHCIGLPLLLIPFYILSEGWGARMFMLLVAVGVLFLTYIWSYEVTKNKKMSVVGSVVLLACYFFNGLSGYVYPDLIIAGLLLASLIIIQKKIVS